MFTKKFFERYYNSPPWTKLLLVLVAKVLVLGGCMLPIAFGVLGTGILFAGYNLAVSRNPEEVENLFNSTLMGFALMETFIFLSIIVGYIIFNAV
jgi:F0F1-type ATP synthase membrane subunit c/vacuolar-type H+-ATPase subunit K